MDRSRTLWRKGRKSSRRAALASAVTAGVRGIEPLESRVLFAAGDKDLLFGGTGMVTQDIAATDDGVDGGQQAIGQNAGKLIVVGDTGTGGQGGQDGFVSRRNPDGSLDTSFGVGGLARLHLDAGGTIFTGVQVLPDDSILVCGVVGDTSNGQGDFVVAKYTPDGQLDTAFNAAGATPGVRVTDFGGEDAAADLAVTTAGRIIVVGTSIQAGGGGGGAAVEFLTPGGSPDGSQGSAQFVTNPGVVTIEGATAVALTPDGGFVTSGFSYGIVVQRSSFQVMRFDAAGNVVTSFGTNGRKLVNFANQPMELAAGIAVDPTSGKIVASGVTADGVIELAPGLLQGAHGAAATEGDFAIARLNADGSLDPTLNGTGTVTVDFGNNVDGSSDVLVQADGKIVATGGSADAATGGSDFATVRLTAGGQLDSTFGTGGRVVTDFQQSDAAFGMVRMANGEYFEVGHTKGAANSDVAMVVYQTDPSATGGGATLSINSPSIAEGNAGQSNLVFTVTLSAAQAGAVTVDFATATGTANTADFQPVSGTLTFAPGETTKQVSVPIFGDTAVEPDETFTVNLSNPTGNATVATAQGTGTILNDDAAGTGGGATLSIDSPSILEGNAGQTNLVFTVTLSAAQAGTVTVDFATATGTAGTADFQAVSGTLTFAPGERTKQVSVPVFGDTQVEPDETFTVNLSNPTGTATIAAAQGTGTIRNDDAASRPGGTLSIDSPSILEGDAGQTSLVFTVTLSDAQADPVTVDFTTATGTAGTSDYQPVSGTLTFAAGETSKQIVVPVIGDTAVEPDETFTVNLSNPTGNATVATAQGTGTILNDDGGAPPVLPSLSIAGVVGKEGTGAAPTAFVFTVTLSQASTQTVTVDFATADGSATAPSDYAATTGTLTFAPGTTTQTITVPVVADTSPEAPEKFTVTLSNPSGAVVAVQQGTGEIENDDTTPATTGGPVTLGTFTAKKLPATIIGGDKKATAQFLVPVTNTSNATIKGTVTVSIFGSTDLIFDAGSDAVIGTGKKKVTLKPNQTKTITVKVKFPAVAADADLTLFARATGAGITDPAGVLQVFGRTVHVQKPTVILTGSTTPQAARSVKFGAKTSLAVPLTNGGNEPAKSKATFQLVVTTDGTPATAVTSVTLPKTSISINPHATKTVKGSFKVPPASAGLPSGSYVLLVVLQNAGTNPANATDGSVVAVVPFTVS